MLKRVDACLYFIFITGYLRRTAYGAHQLVVGRIDVGALWIVYVVDNEIALVSAHNALPVARAEHVALKCRHLAVGILERYAVLKVHALIRLYHR